MTVGSSFHSLGTPILTPWVSSLQWRPKGQYPHRTNHPQKHLTVPHLNSTGSSPKIASKKGRGKVKKYGDEDTRGRPIPCRSHKVSPILTGDLSPRDSGPESVGKDGGPGETSCPKRLQVRLPLWTGRRERDLPQMTPSEFTENKYRTRVVSSQRSEWRSEWCPEDK